MVQSLNGRFSVDGVSPGSMPNIRRRSINSNFLMATACRRGIGMASLIHRFPYRGISVLPSTLRWLLLLHAHDQALHKSQGKMLPLHLVKQHWPSYHASDLQRFPSVWALHLEGV